MRKRPRGRAPRGGGPSVVYVVAQFPSVTETFILREVLTLIEMGFSVSILSRRKPTERVLDADARRLCDVTIYLPSHFSAAALFAPLGAALRYPLGSLSALFTVLRLSLRHPTCIRELFGSLSAAGRWALALPRRPRHIHCQFGSQPATVGMLLAEITGRGYSIAFHSRDIFTRESVLVANKIAEADFVTVCTDFGIKPLLRQYQLLAADKFYLIYHGVDPSLYPPAPLRPPGKPLLLAVGQLVEKKGYPILLRACAILRGRGVNLHLRIVGAGPDQADLDRLANGMGLAEYVEFDGDPSQEKLMHAYAEADVFVAASVVAADGDRDGLPIPLIEAMAMGIPVVASDLGAIPELVRDEETGLLATPGDPEDLADKLERAIYDEGLRDAVSVAGRETVIRDFDIRRNVQLLAELFREAMSR